MQYTQDDVLLKIKDSSDQTIINLLAIDVCKEFENVVLTEDGRVPESVGVYITQLKNLANQKLKTVQVKTITLSSGKEVYVTFVIEVVATVETVKIHMTVV